MSGVCLLDTSAAFDTVESYLLLKKLRIYGFEDDVIRWFSTYLNGRRQSVCINGIMSRQMTVPSGVPQGSILGPLLYTLYTNELPEVIHEEKDSNIPNQAHKFPNYTSGNNDLESICCFADDTTVTCSNSDHSQLTQPLTKYYKSISDFMIDSGL